MSQLSNYVAVTSGSAVVYAVWDIILSAASGTFTVGEAVTFSGSGATATVVAWLPGSSTKLRVYVTSTAMPAAGNTATGGSSSATGNVSTFSTSSAWATDVDAGDVFTISESGVAYLVGSVDTHAKLTLAANYAAATNTYQQGYISTSFSPSKSIAYPEVGDKDTETVTKQGTLTVDTALAAVPSLSTEQVWTASQHPQANEITHSSGVLTIDLAVSTFHVVQLSGVAVSSIAFTNKPTTGALATVVINQDATTGVAVSSWSGLDFGDAGAPTGYTSPGDALVLSLVVTPAGTVLASAGAF